MISLLFEPVPVRHCRSDLESPLKRHQPVRPGPSPPCGGHSPDAPARSSGGKQSCHLRKSAGMGPQTRMRMKEEACRRSLPRPLRRFAPASWRGNCRSGALDYHQKRPERFLHLRSVSQVRQSNPPWIRVHGRLLTWNPTSSGPRRLGWSPSRFPLPEPYCRLRTGR